MEIRNRIECEGFSKYNLGYKSQLGDEEWHGKDVCTKYKYIQTRFFT